MVVDLDNPLAPRVTAEIGAPDLVDPQGIAVQFRYAFVVDRQGLKVLDVTDLAHPERHPRSICARWTTRATSTSRAPTPMWPAGKHGLALVNVEQPEQPRLDQIFTAEWRDQRFERRENRRGGRQRLCLSRRRRQRPADAADFSPSDSPNSYGFSPRPTPKLIASYRTAGPGARNLEGH